VWSTHPEAQSIYHIKSILNHTPVPDSVVRKGKGQRQARKVDRQKAITEKIKDNCKKKRLHCV
jgi:hypothetical protein